MPLRVVPPFRPSVLLEEAVEISSSDPPATPEVPQAVIFL